MAELVLSALYAPIMMLIHSTHVYDILAGADAGWSPQRRDGGRRAGSRPGARMAGTVAVGVATAVGAWYLSPRIFPWLSPTLPDLSSPFRFRG